MKKSGVVLLLCLLLPCSQSGAVDTEMTAATVINQSWQRYRQLAAAEQEQLVLTVTRAGEAGQQKQLTRWTRYVQSGEQVVLKFASPAADAGLGLWLDRANRSAQQIWLRMPS